jgi:hypothetical protein
LFQFEAKVRAMKQDPSKAVSVAPQQEFKPEVVEVKKELRDEDKQGIQFTQL